MQRVLHPCYLRCPLVKRPTPAELHTATDKKLNSETYRTWQKTIITASARSDGGPTH